MRGVERQGNMDNTKGDSLVILSRLRELDVGRYTYVKRHNYVSFAATGNKFRRFAREITGDLRTIIHCLAWDRTTLWYPVQEHGQQVAVDVELRSAKHRQCECKKYYVKRSLR